MDKKIILKTQNITKKFSGLVAVNKMNVEINDGERHAIIGPNGSGKTTFINVITGFYTPEEGQVIFDGQDITLDKSYDRTKKGISRTFQNIRLFDDMSIEENIALGMHVNSDYNLLETILHVGRYKKQEKEIFDYVHKVSEDLKIKDILKQNVSELPYGKRRIVEIARGLVAKPKIILLDEPAAGMNNKEVLELADIIRYISDSKITVILIEHNMDFVKDISNTVTVMESGAKIAEGDFDTVSSNPQVIEAYLGKGVKRNAGN